MAGDVIKIYIGDLGLGQVIKTHIQTQIRGDAMAREMGECERHSLLSSVLAKCNN